MFRWENLNLSSIFTRKIFFVVAVLKGVELRAQLFEFDEFR